MNSWQEPHEVASSTLAELASRIVSAEGPIHVKEVTRRVASCFGKEKAGSRIVGATRSALSLANVVTLACFLVHPGSVRSTSRAGSIG